MNKPDRGYSSRHFKEIFIILLTSLLFVLPVLYLTRNQTFRLYSDYDSMLPMYEYNASYIRDHLAFPDWNPDIGFGIPVLGDPLSGVFNPFLMIPFILWGTGSGTRFIFWEIVFLSGVSMWFLVKSLGISKSFRIWAACLYSVSGTIVARFGAGHIEQFFAFPLIPLIISFSFNQNLRIRNIVLTGLCLSGLYYSGSAYHLFYLLIMVTLIRIYYLVTDKTRRVEQFKIWLGIVLTVFVISFPKLSDFYFRVMPLMQRTISDPTRGSLSVQYFLLPFLMPFSVLFYGRPRLNTLIGIYFNWYEYYAFIAPFPLILLYKFRPVWKSGKIRILLMLLIAGALFIACRYLYSPFNWAYKLIPFFSVFRVPQRMYIPMNVILISLMALAGDIFIRYRTYKKWTVYLFYLSGFLMTFAVTQRLFLTEAFEEKFKDAETVVTMLRDYDPGNYYVASLYPRLQGYLIRSKIPVINYYYGWTNTASPVYSSDENQLILTEFTKIRPEYVIISAKENRLINVGYHKIIKIGKAAVWQTDSWNVKPEK
jgi:hypothetical protein